MMTTLAPASLLQEHQEHRAHVVGPLSFRLGLDLATPTGTHMHCDSDTRCSPRSQDLTLTSQGWCLQDLKQS